MKGQLCFKCATSKEHLKRDEILNVIKMIGKNVSNVTQNIDYIEYKIPYRKITYHEENIYEMDLTDYCGTFGTETWQLEQDDDIYYVCRHENRVIVGFDHRVVKDERLKILDPNVPFIYRFIRGESNFGIGYAGKSTFHVINKKLYIFRFVKME
jgi:hypothetical protein